MSEVTIYSSSADGYVDKIDETSWADAHDATVGDNVASALQSHVAGIYARGGSGFYAVRRSFLYFDLSELSLEGAIQSIELQIAKYVDGDSSVCVQEGTQGSSLSLSDINAFAGNSFGHISWAGAEEYKTIILDKNGRDFIKSKLGTGIAKFCCREYTHDYNNTPPSTGKPNGLRYTENVGVDYDPKLVIQYGGVTGPDEIITEIVCSTISDKDARIEIAGAKLGDFELSSFVSAKYPKWTICQYIRCAHIPARNAQNVSIGQTIQLRVYNPDSFFRVDPTSFQIRFNGGSWISYGDPSISVECISFREYLFYVAPPSFAYDSEVTGEVCCSDVYGNKGLLLEIL